VLYASRAELTTLPSTNTSTVGDPGVALLTRKLEKSFSGRYSSGLHPVINTTDAVMMQRGRKICLSFIILFVLKVLDQ
jgi:hypothetical protein